MSEKHKNRDGVFFILHLAHWCDMMKTRNHACIFLSRPTTEQGTAPHRCRAVPDGVLFETAVSAP